MNGVGFTALPSLQRAMSRAVAEDPNVSLRDRIEAAQRTGDETVLQRLEDEFRQRIRDGDPEAVGIYREHQAEVMPADPLTEGACEWPAELSQSEAVLQVPESEPILAWRMWSIRGSRLVAPFQITKRSRKLPGIEWKRGANVNTTRWCDEGSLAKFHPRPWTAGCQCGIRAVQSRTVLDAFAEQMATRNPPVLGDAIAQVRVWGNVGGFRADDDWEFTLRAQYAEIVGPLEIRAEHEPQAAAIERRYGVDVVVS